MISQGDLQKKTASKTSSSLMSEEIKIEQIQKIISKFKMKRFDGLSLEDLAVALSYPNFPKYFKDQTDEDWNSKYSVKAIERLNNCRFDIQWVTRKCMDYYKPLFSNIARGDLGKVKDFIRQFSKDPSLRSAVNDQKKSPLHVSVIEGRYEITEYLILENFKVNARDKTLKTPLHYSCMFGNL